MNDPFIIDKNKITKCKKAITNVIYIYEEREREREERGKKN
jgi:hypothetical protein